VKKENVRSILFITLSNLGDIILTTPVLDSLCRNFPGVFVDVVTGAPGEQIFRAHPAVRDITVRGKRLGMKARLEEISVWRKKRYDLVVDLKNSLVPYLTGAKMHTVLSFREPSAAHKKDIHLSKLSSAGIKDTALARFFVPVTSEEKEFVSGVLAGSLDPAAPRAKTIMINPGAKSHLKRWPDRKYAALADRLISELGCAVIITGNEDDREVVNNTVKKMVHRAVDLCGKTSLGALFELARRADLVITNDSAPLHVASAASTPTIALFGPSDEKKYGPLAPGSAVIKPKVHCRPCGKALCARGPNEGCLPSIEVEEVFETAKRSLS
jgi:heptosyltransferase I